MDTQSGHQFRLLNQRAMLLALDRKLTHQRIKLQDIALKSNHGHRGTDILELHSRCRTTHSKLQKLKLTVGEGHASTTDSKSSGGRAPITGSETSKSAGSHSRRQPSRKFNHLSRT